MNKYSVIYFKLKGLDKLIYVRGYRIHLSGDVRFANLHFTYDKLKARQIWNLHLEYVLDAVKLNFKDMLDFVEIEKIKND